jgi:hypothetical protein
MSTLAPTLQTYFTDRLIGQRAASPNTIAAYRYTFCLLLRFASERSEGASCRYGIKDRTEPSGASLVGTISVGRRSGSKETSKPNRSPPRALPR